MVDSPWSIVFYLWTIDYQPIKTIFMKKATLLALMIFAVQHVFSQNEETENYRVFLKDDWKMQSAVTDISPGKSISQPGFQTVNWYKVSVPTTVIAGLLANKV